MIHPFVNRLRAAWQIVAKGSLFPFNKLLPSGGSGGDRLTQAYANSTWVMRAIKKIAGPISAVSLNFSIDARRGESLYNDPALNAFWEHPAQGLTANDFIEATVGWLKIEGEAFWILDDTWLRPFAEIAKRSPMIVARPDRMRHIVQGGEIVGWEFTDANGRREILIPEQVIQCKFWNPYDPFRGLGEFQAAKVAAESDYLAGKFNLHLMQNNGDRGVYVIAKGGIPTDEQRSQITQQLREKRELSQRGHFKPIFLSGDISLEDPKIQVPDAAFLATRMENRHEIFIALGVPPSMADVTQSYSIGSASDRFILIEETCVPLADKIADCIQVAVKRQTGKPLFAWFKWDEHSVMQQVRGERIDAAVKLFGTGMPMREVNNYLNLGMPEFPGWETGYLPFGLAPVDAMERTPLQDPATGEDFAETPPKSVGAALPRSPEIQRLRKALMARAEKTDAEKEQDAAESFQSNRPARDKARWRTLMAHRREIIKAYESRFNRELMKARQETLARLQKAQISNLRSQISKAAAADFIFDLAGWKVGFLASMRGIAAKALQTAGKQLFEELKKDDPFTMPEAAVLQFQRSRDNRLTDVADDVFANVRDTIEGGLSIGETLGEIQDRVRAVFNDISKARAKTIAMTETATAYSQGRAVAMKSAGVKWKRWLTSGNTNVRPTHRVADGATVPIDEAFIVGGEHLMHPSDPNGSPENVINCHCVSIAVEAPPES